MSINPVVLGLLIALAVFPWLILAVHMYVYHIRTALDNLYLRAYLDYRAWQEDAVRDIEEAERTDEPF